MCIVGHLQGVIRSRCGIHETGSSEVVDVEDAHPARLDIDCRGVSEVRSEAEASVSAGRAAVFI